MTTLKRTLPVAFSDTSDLQRFVPSLTELPVAGAVRRYSAISAAKTIPEGGAITTVPNLGTAAGDLAPGSNGAPTLRFDAKQYPYMQFDGVDDRLQATTTDAAGAEARTIYSVARFGAVPGASNFYQTAAFGQTSGTGISLNSSGDLIMFRGKTFTSTLVPGSDWHIVVAVFNGASSVLRIDNQPEQTGDAGTSSITTSFFTLAGHAPSGTPAEIDVMEAGWFDSALSSDDRQALVTALASQYGLTI